MTQAKEPECAFSLGGVSKLMARAIIFGYALADDDDDDDDINLRPRDLPKGIGTC
jgi:hypothetical protein